MRLGLRPVANSLKLLKLLIKTGIALGFLMGLLTSMDPSNCQGASSFEKEESDIPVKPSAPPALTQKIPGYSPHCERYFEYRGKWLECDSNVSRDGEALRSIMNDVPSAIAELD